MGSTGAMKPPIKKSQLIGQRMQTALFNKPNNIKRADQISATVVSKYIRFE